MTTPQENTESGIDMRSLWSALDPATRQWFMDHTGNTIVPRKITAELCEVAGRPLPHDSHGQLQLSGDDIVFIRNRAHSAFAAHGTERFFEAVQPKDASQAHHSPHTDLPHRT
ncbi:hypothetical protein NIBR502772_12440 [Pseudarthrobacter sp. NIBRBAC000502772]|uniref:hypothetical protein n=1 Tax=Pseudarthrobacter sp. NIBRBAC000502772 TaxID=2590775 RepID=UPI001131E285|nr:hypothetical protein [Pseudarthrobacter sp. NIBRBAC000502772]QDG66903.1 hypothetical protein NIBR502772_12440 [Pseudarthrobacter sp. NIBRBAC000502772]